MKKFLLTALFAIALIAPVSAGNGTGTYVTKQLDVNFSASGDNTVIAAAGAGQRVVVWKMWLVSVGGATNLIFKDGSTAYNASALPLTAAGSSITFQFDGEPYFGPGTAGSSFVINNSNAVQVTGRVYYSIVQQ